MQFETGNLVETSKPKRRFEVSGYLSSFEHSVTCEFDVLQPDFQKCPAEIDPTATDDNCGGSRHDVCLRVGSHQPVQMPYGFRVAIDES